MRTLFKSLLAVLLVLTLTACAFAFWTVSRQGVPDEFWQTYPTAQVRFDEHGIPTIEAADWLGVVRAQGYVVASQRLWQMDLIRRKAGGRLAELFGAVAFEHDAATQVEDRLAIARQDARALPDSERRYCEAYAQGVNEFIREQHGRWGLEYALLRAEPEPWSCADSLLVMLEMTEALSATAEREAQQSVWRRELSPAWAAFLFTSDHPWNRPLFDAPHPASAALPPAAEALPRRPLDPQTEARARFEDSDSIGSNNWVWRGATGAFVANDPHLGYSVPSIWFANRLRVAKDDWAVGVSIPGIPGVVLGMTPSLAWAFTNTGEDVDDYLLETVSDDGSKYLAETWQPVVKKTYEIRVHGEARPRVVTGAFTRRGPLARRRFLGSGLYSRQWLPLKPGMLRLPTVAVMQATTLEKFDQALDGMAAPSQNVLVMNREGDFGYRMSGTGVVRRVTGSVPQPAAAGEWQGFSPAATRLRRYYKGEGSQTRHLATANQRLWVDPLGATWYSDDRWERLDRALSSRDDFHRQDMERLQLDTESRFRRLLLGWVGDRAGAVSGPAAELVGRWRKWDGTSRGDARSFTEAGLAEAALTKVLLGRVQATFKNADDRAVPYLGFMRRAWLTTLIEAPGDTGVAPFGLEGGEVARFLIDRIIARDKGLVLQPEANRWQGQHPFVGRIPLVGRLFALDEFPQWGASDVVLAEQPTFGPSVRLVWDLRSPGESTWVFPIGQSGHALSKHFKDFHALWPTGERVAVFADGQDWGF